MPGGAYKGQSAPVKTFGVRVAAIASEDLPDEIAYTIVKAVLKDLDVFKRLHPALGGMEAKDMGGNGITAPLHPGAVKYFRESGIM